MNKGDPCRVIRLRLKPGDVAIDVGAGEGTESEAMAIAVGETGHVHSLEPDPQRWKALAAKVADRSVTVYHAAAGSRSGDAVLYQATRADQSSLFDALAGLREAAKPIPTVMLRLDDLPVTNVALVKIDAQGSEMDILRGAERLLQTCPCWIIELWPHGLHVAGTSAQAVVDHLRAAGLTVHCLGEDPDITDEMLATWAPRCGVAKYVNIEARR